MGSTTSTQFRQFVSDEEVLLTLLCYQIHLLCSGLRKHFSYLTTTSFRKSSLKAFSVEVFMLPLQFSFIRFVYIVVLST